MRAKLLAIGMMLLIANPGGAAEIRSLYTDLTDKACQVTGQAKAGEGDWVNLLCPGVFGYQLTKVDDDARQSLSLVRDGKVQGLHFFGHVTPAFNHLGDKAEWRMQGQEPMALIVRMHIQEQAPDGASHKRQVLIVSKLAAAQSCVVKIINASKEKDANHEAQAAADRAHDMACLW